MLLFMPLINIVFSSHPFASVYSLSGLKGRWSRGRVFIRSSLKNTRTDVLFLFQNFEKVTIPVRIMLEFKNKNIKLPIVGGRQCPVFERIYELNR